ncbi:MAG: DUF2808 domain-containing protein [Okeania sp. SIO2C2]|uniref:DUF2808 domain-containing protein n=1 Tax=Okeania sp. SIO2C2 TaxID=2607787 RepID=UPI0013BB52A7|nr:DUF2808 domain-containing protein [Okeania sp. SIO2C2]NEP86539.1 DUF2808 domain-containing protein [Okeania sp. SIO2C2]
MLVPKLKIFSFFFIVCYFLVTPTLAIQTKDGTVYFAQPPRLVKAVTTRSETYVWSATYYFTLSLLPDARVPLERVTITKTEGSGNIRYNPKKIIAFEGTHRQKGQQLAVEEVAVVRETNTVSVTFNPPVPPGKTFTIGLRPVRTPKYGGIYLFGVTAFPVGEKSSGHFLGYGRLHFYDSSNSYD